MSLKQFLSSTILLSSSLLARADSGYGSGSGSSGYGGSGSGSSNYGSSSNNGYNSGSGGNNYGNQGYQSSSMDSGMGGKGGMGSSHSTTDMNQGFAFTLVETIAITETKMMTTTVTETSCSTQAMATWGSGSSMGGGMSGGSWGSSSSSSTSISIQIVTVSDDSGALSYFPDSVVAAVGSIVEFHYYPKNHTVTQSSFAAPCVPINLSTPNMTTPGIKSGFVPVASNATDFMKGIRSTFSVMVNDTKPIWIFCGQVGHCQKGMSMVINQNMTDTVKTLANYQAAAAMIPVVNGTMTTPPSSGSASAEQSTSTSTFTAAAFPPPAAATEPPVVSTQPPVVATTANPVGQLTTTTPGVATFTGAAVGLIANKLSAAAGVIALGVAALL